MFFLISRLDLKKQRLIAGISVGGSMPMIMPPKILVANPNQKTMIRTMFFLKKRRMDLKFILVCAFLEDEMIIGRC